MGHFFFANCYLDFSNPLQIPLPKPQSEQYPLLTIFKKTKAKRGQNPPARRFLSPETCRKSRTPRAAPEPSCAGTPPSQGLVSSKGLFADPKHPFFRLKLAFPQQPCLGLGVPGPLLPPRCCSGFLLHREPKEELGLCPGRGSLLLISLVIYCAMLVNGSSPSPANHRGCSALIPQSLGSAPISEPTLEPPHTGDTRGVTTRSLKKNNSAAVPWS